MKRLKTIGQVLDSGERYHVFTYMTECFESCRNAQEAGELIARLMEDEDIAVDDIYVIKGVKVTLTATKRRALTISFDDKKVYEEE